MTRIVLTLTLSVLALAVGIATSVVASYNQARGANLSLLQRKLEILRAAGDQAEASAAAHVWGQAPDAPATPAARPAAEAQEATP